MIRAYLFEKESLCFLIVVKRACALVMSVRERWLTEYEQVEAESIDHTPTLGVLILCINFLEGSDPYAIEKQCVYRMHF